jgi:hypothetical protein
MVMLGTGKTKGKQQAEILGSEPKSFRFSGRNPGLMTGWMRVNQEWLAARNMDVLRS